MHSSGLDWVELDALDWKLYMDLEKRYCLHIWLLLD
jgi:hypothetical protein